ncbi:MAG: hypothetical protein ACRER2_13925 [Methylococcales bacterium]
MSAGIADIQNTGMCLGHCHPWFLDSGNPRESVHTGFMKAPAAMTIERLWQSVMDRGEIKSTH